MLKKSKFSCLSDRLIRGELKDMEMESNTVLFTFTLSLVQYLVFRNCREAGVLMGAYHILPDFF